MATVRKIKITFNSIAKGICTAFTALFLGISFVTGLVLALPVLVLSLLFL